MQLLTGVAISECVHVDGVWKFVRTSVQLIVNFVRIAEVFETTCVHGNCVNVCVCVCVCF